MEDDIRHTAMRLFLLVRHNLERAQLAWLGEDIPADGVTFISECEKALEHLRVLAEHDLQVHTRMIEALKAE